MASNSDLVAEMDYVDLFGNTVRVRPKINMYANNDNLYVGLDCYDQEFGGWEPYCDVTVNIRKLPFLESAIDVNNNDYHILKFLSDQGFGNLTEKVLPSGFCVFPVFRFNADKLQEIDSKMFSEYLKCHGRQPMQSHKALDTSIRDAVNRKNKENSADAPISESPLHEER